MVSDRAFIFHTYISWGKSLSLLPKSRSSVKVKVKYQGHSFKKKWLLRVHWCFTNTSYCILLLPLSSIFLPSLYVTPGKQMYTEICLSCLSFHLSFCPSVLVILYRELLLQFCCYCFETL